VKINRTDAMTSGQPLKFKKEVKEDKGFETPKDGVVLSGDKGGGPNVIVGAYTGRLDPRIPLPDGGSHIMFFPGLEIQDGIGIALDGQSIIAANNNKDGHISIKSYYAPPPASGESPVVSYPEKSFEVSRKDGTTVFDGCYTWQHYTITEKDGKTTIKFEDDSVGRFDYQIFQEENKTRLVGKFPFQNFTITKEGNKTIVKGSDDVLNYTVTKKGNVTKVKGNIPSRNFTITDKGSEWEIKNQGDNQYIKIKKSPKEVEMLFR